MADIKVLYIEDNDAQRVEFTKLLNSRGFEVSPAGDGEEGLKKLRSEGFDIILCDLHMPGISGLEVLAEVRKICPDTPFLILTAHGSLDVAVDAIKQGADHFIRKPLNIDDMEIHLHQTLERSAMAKELKESSRRLEDIVDERTERLKFVNRQLQALNELSGELTRIHDEEALYDKVAEYLTETLDFDRGMFFLLENGDLKLRSACFSKDPPEMLETFKRNIEHGIFEMPPHLMESIEENRSILIRDLNADPRWPREEGRVIRTKALVIAPVRVKDEPIGVIVGNLQHHKREMDDQDVARFGMFANMVGLALDNIRVYRSLERKVDERTRSLRSAYTELDEKASQLSQSRDQLQAILDSSIPAMIMVDEQNTITAVNRRTHEFFGVDTETLMSRPLDFFHEKIRGCFKDPSRHDDLIRELSAQFDKEAKHVIDASLMADRAIEIIDPVPRLVSMISIPVLNREDRELGRVWIYIDITDVKKAEEQVRLIVDNSPTPTIISRLEDGRIIYVNDQLANLMGYTQEEALEKSTVELYYKKEDRTEVVKRLKANGQLRDFEMQFVRKDGAVLWITLNLVVTQFRGENVILGGLSDITERKKAEDELRKERNFVSAILNTAGALVVVLDPEGKILRFNKACERISGYDWKEVVGKNFAEIFILPEEMDMLTERFEIIKNSRKRVDDDNYWLTKDGRKRMISWSNNVMLDENGEVEYVIATGIDITERKAAEDKLRLYRELYLNSKDGIVIVTKDGYYLESNPAYLKQTGYKSEDLKGRRMTELMGIPDPDKFHKDLVEKGGFRGEMTIHTQDGRDLPFDVSVFTIEDSEGEVANVAGIGRDISEQKAARAALSKRVWYEEGLAACSQALLTNTNFDDALREALFHLLVASRSSRAYIFENFEDPEDGLCMRQTHEVCDTGVEPQINNPELRHVPYKEGFQRWSKILERGEGISGPVSEFPEEEREVLEAQGIVSIIVFPITVEGKWYGFIGFDECRQQREDTEEDLRLLRTASEMIGSFVESKKFEESLRVSEERFRSLVENASDVIYSIRPDGTFSYISPQFTESTGYDVEEYIGKPSTLLLSDEYIDESKEWFSSGMPKHDEHVEGYQFKIKTKSGDLRWFTAHTAIIRDENGNVIEGIGIAHDITEIKKLLESLEKTNRELVDTQAQLVQTEKMASLGQLVAGVAHEINTPIGAVNSMHNSLVRAVEKLKRILEEKYPDEIKEGGELQKYLKVISEANKVIESGSERVTTIVRRLRSFARLDEAELKSCDIHEGLEDTLTLIHHEIKHNIEVIREYGDLPRFSCYPGRLNQVFLNILNNARQAIREKGQIKLKTYQKDNFVHIEISDNGMGIAKKDLKKIFDPGFTTKGVGVGTGLGLSICYQIVKGHYGDIKVQSEVGKGTTFTIKLPLNLDDILEEQKNKK
ncbi:MAG: PAS domain S-box protein [candidate division Zixibacteria bacterium]|nr:PAS domain S-box protein [candidate division Zixibacteria bacterium]